MTSPNWIPELDLSTPIASDAAKRGLTRQQAIEEGRRFGEDEARRRNESPEWADSRIRRAMMYAAWDYDGRPIGRGEEYLEEFGLPSTKLGIRGVQSGADFVKGRET
jgi:hypothetical protein